MPKNEKYLFDLLREEFGKRFIEDIHLPKDITTNLAPRFTLRPYQIETFKRFICLYENGFSFKTNHLLFNMATGSGKTLIMAGLILYLYGKGYRNFLFFVNSNNLIDKTIANLKDQTSTKYLFKSEILFDNKKADIVQVDNFEGVNEENINICFTTIQKLHEDITVQKENSITIEDFKDKKIALIADECHHLNATSKKDKELFEKPTWENTVESIFKQNPKNMLLEFTATIEWEKKNIAEKYYPKTLMRYDLKAFRDGGYSKEIDILQADFGKKDRIVQAIILSQYKQEVASKNKLDIKPVILFRSNRIDESKENQIFFNQIIENLSQEDIGTIEKAVFASENNILMKRVFKYFADQRITKDILIKKLKMSFAPNKCLNVNEGDLDKKSTKKEDRQEVVSQQKLLNELEAKDNQIRAIFAVYKLNEGWDVLNLFDIVRLSEGRSVVDRKPGKATISEAQLIGRGARYYPFTFVGNPALPKDKRKFDKDIDNDLRILEEMHYHSIRDNKYITELRQELIKQGLVDDKHVDRKLSLKDSFKKTAFYEKGVVYGNKQIEATPNDWKIFEESKYIGQNFAYRIYTGHGKNEVLLLDTEAEIEAKRNEGQTGIETKDFAIKDFAPNVKEQVLKANVFYRYENLTKYADKISSVNEFIIKFLNSFKISVSGAKAQIETLDNTMQYQALSAFVEALAQEAKGNITEFKGSPTFEPKPISEVFKDKILRLLKDTPRTDGDEAFLANKDWYAYNANFGTAEEKALTRFFDKKIAELNKKFDEVYLLRNELFFPIYDFAQGRPFYPDFILFLKENKDQMKTYQIFIEPKGEHLEPAEKWKEDFLKAIRKKYDKTIFKDSLGMYDILGIPFYNQTDENAFGEELFASIN